MNSHELPQKSKAEVEKGGETAKKLRKLGLSMSLLFGAGFMADKLAGKNLEEKGSAKPPAESIVKSENNNIEAHITGGVVDHAKISAEAVDIKDIIQERAVADQKADPNNFLNKEIDVNTSKVSIGSIDYAKIADKLETSKTIEE